MTAGRVISKIFSVIVSIITIGIILFVICYMWFFPYVLKLQPYIVKSGSMEPAIPTGSVEFVNLKDTDPEPGDIITYRIDEDEYVGVGGDLVQRAQAGTLVTHRMTRVDDFGKFVTKGDANDMEDFISIDPSQVVGTYKWHIPKLGFILAKINNKTRLFGAIILVLLNITAMCFSFAFSPDDEEDKEEEKKEEEKDDSSEENPEKEEKPAEETPKEEPVPEN